MTFNLLELTDLDLMELERAVAEERKRRTRLVEIPAQAASLAQEYLGAGGVVSDLVAAFKDLDPGA